MDEYEMDGVVKKMQGKPQYEIKVCLIQILSDLWAIWKSYGSRRLAKCLKCQLSQVIIGRESFLHVHCEQRVFKKPASPCSPLYSSRD
jgi:hypothetical protein